MSIPPAPKLFLLSLGGYNESKSSLDHGHGYARGDDGDNDRDDDLYVHVYDHV